MDNYADSSKSDSMQFKKFNEEKRTPFVHFKRNISRAYFWSWVCSSSSHSKRRQASCLYKWIMKWQLWYSLLFKVVVQFVFWVVHLVCWIIFLPKSKLFPLRLFPKRLVNILVLFSAACQNLPGYTPTRFIFSSSYDNLRFQIPKGVISQVKCWLEMHSKVPS